LKAPISPVAIFLKLPPPPSGDQGKYAMPYSLQISMTYELRDLKDQVIVITGATAGMGAATAKELVEQGAKVVLNARNEARLKEIVAELGEANAVYVAGDCSEPDVSRAIAKAALKI
jgi:FlaA1/EpsC-like NDP-sugar epimerase